MNTAGRLYMPVSSWVESQAVLCNTAVEKFTTPGLFQIQPNPTTGKFYVSLPAEYQGPITVQIFDATAKLLHSEVFQNPMQKYEIAPGNQYKGILQVRVKTADKCQTQKLIMY
jgi:hypothetical protein